MKVSLRSFLVLAIILSFSVLIGCAGMEYAPKGPYQWYHQELPAAEKAVDSARAAGKDKKCPQEFKAAEDMKNKAYEEYWALLRQRPGARILVSTFWIFPSSIVATPSIFPISRIGWGLSLN